VDNTSITLQALRVSKIVGIDLGTTNSAVAVMDAGIPGILADENGGRLLPSIVHYPESGNILVGEPARRMQFSQPERTVSSIKRLIGKTEKVNLEGWGCKVSENPIGVEIDGGIQLPEAVSAEILKALKRTAESVLCETVDRAVITVPAYFNDGERLATKRAGELAGFTVERIINEPTAAALACGLKSLEEGSRVAVYDFGGGTFDLSILEIREGVFEVLATHGNTALGGDDIDSEIASWMRAKIDRELDATALARVNAEAEKVKISLSSSMSTSIKLPFISSDLSFECDVTRGEIEKLALPTLERTRAHCMRALGDSGLNAKDLSQVVLVGGQTRMPLVRRLVAEWFECPEYEEISGGIRLGDSFHKIKGPILNVSTNPDEAVALGASIQGAILSGEVSGLLLLDVTPLSLGLETFGGLMNVIIPRNTTIPTRAGEIFTNAVDGQEKMLIHVLQGEREKSGDNWSIGRFEIAFERIKRGAARVGVQFEIDANGILNVLARDTKTGLEKIVSLSSAINVEENQVHEMIEQSVEHAFEDMDSRKWIEAAAKAKEAVNAARLGLDSFAGEIDCSNAITASIQEVETILEASGKTTGDLPGLKSAVSGLDKVTMPMAELMMDQAIEMILKRQNGID